MNKQSFTEELKEHLGALEAKLEAEIGENIKLLGDLRYYEEMRIPELERQLAEARAEVERLKNEHEESLRRAKDNAVSLSGTVTKYAGELLAKDKLIEQMRDALKLALPEARSTHCENTIKAALAAERGE